jgi:hypothetical protein
MTGQRHPLHQCEDTLDCFVAARRPELLGTARVVGHQENGRLLRPLSETA